jgi:hypothetical protein
MSTLSVVLGVLQVLLLVGLALQLRAGRRARLADEVDRAEHARFMAVAGVRFRPPAAPERPAKTLHPRPVGQRTNAHRVPAA